MQRSDHLKPGFFDGRDANDVPSYRNLFTEDEQEIFKAGDADHDEEAAVQDIDRGTDQAHQSQSQNQCNTRAKRKEEPDPPRSEKNSEQN